MDVCVCVYVLKRNYFKDLMQYTWKMKANPTWKECYHRFSWFHLLDKSSFGCFSYCCLSLPTMVIVMFFSSSLSLPFSSSSGWWWFCASFYPKRALMILDGCSLYEHISQHWTTQFIHSMTEWKCRRNPYNLLFAQQNWVFEHRCCCAGTVIVLAFVFLATSFNSLFPIWLIWHFHVFFPIRLPTNH